MFWQSTLSPFSFMFPYFNALSLQHCLHCKADSITNNINNVEGMHLIVIPARNHLQHYSSVSLNQRQLIRTAVAAHQQTILPLGNREYEKRDDRVAQMKPLSSTRRFCNNHLPFSQFVTSTRLWMPSLGRLLLD